MRISDWSSDVCSSDLAVPRTPQDRGLSGQDREAGAPAVGDVRISRGDFRHESPRQAACRSRTGARDAPAPGRYALFPLHRRAVRSEEHTSELQSLMRISYAVFCLKKKTNNIPTLQQTPTPHNLMKQD